MSIERTGLGENTADRLLLPTSLPELTYSSIQKVDIGDNMALCPGMNMRDADDEKQDIWGVYGIRYLDPITLRPVARCGFDVDSHALVVTHTPQGDLPFRLQEEESLRLRRADFRFIMMRKMIDLASSLGMAYVTGTVSSFHHKVVNGMISPEEGKKFIDRPFTREYYGRQFEVVGQKYYLALK